MNRSARRLLAAIVTAISMALASFVAAPSAEAATGWTTLARSGRGSVFLACKISESGGYGPVWKVRLVLATKPRDTAVAWLDILRPRADRYYDTVDVNGLNASNGSWDVQETYASQLGSYFDGSWHPDQFHYNVRFNGGRDIYRYPQSMSAINDC